MDWIRRNWPDLLIGLALILVISGIIVTLLNGGTFNPFGQRGAGTASLSSQPAANEEATLETETQLEDAADVSVLPLPSVGEQGASDQNDTATTDSVLGDSVATAVGDASEGLSEAATEVGTAAQGVLPDPNETMNDSDPLASDLDNADPLASDIEAVDVEADTSSTADSAALDGDEAEQAGSVEAVLPDDSSDLNAANAIEDSSADTDLADAASAELADTSIETAISADVAASSSADAPYRVSAGSFGVAANAERLASELRAANYPVFTARQGDLTIVLVGPYDDGAQAEQVARQIESEGLAPGTEVYEFDPSADDDTAVSETQTGDAQVAETQIQDEAVSSEAVSSGSATETQVTEAQTPETQTETQAEVVVVAPAETVSEAEAIVDAVAQETVVQEDAAQETVVDSSTNESTEALAVGGSPTNVNVPPTSETGSYLQVGAYGSIESSNPQRRALEDLGFTVLYVEEQGLVKLLVGPYDGQNVATAKSQLGSQGIVSFIR